MTGSRLLNESERRKRHHHHRRSRSRSCSGQNKKKERVKEEKYERKRRKLSSDRSEKKRVHSPLHRGQRSQSSSSSSSSSEEEKSKHRGRATKDKVDARRQSSIEKREHKLKRGKKKSKSKEGRRQKRRKDKSTSSDRESASSDSSSSDDADENRLPSQVKSLLKDKQQFQSDAHVEKERLKLYETPEEKRARRIAKKQKKFLKRQQQLGVDQSIAYTDVVNPFGDPNLLSTFVWEKKEERDSKLSKPNGDSKRRGEKERTPINAVEELEKVKKRRLEREKEKQARQDAIVTEQRNREKEYFAQWESQEDSFHLSQAKLRSTIRIQDGRAKAIDLLAKYISTEEADQQLAVEMHDPQKFIQGLKMRDLEDLLEDIKVYIELEEGKNAEYWRDITIVVHDEMSRLLNLSESTSSSSSVSHDHNEGVAQTRAALSTSVATEVDKIFQGKSEGDLLKLKTSIETKLKTNTNIDTVYWESLLKKLIAHIARVRLTERHKETLRQKLFKLKHEQGVEVSKPLFPVEKKVGSDAATRLDNRDDANKDKQKSMVASTSAPSSSSSSSSSAATTEQPTQPPPAQLTVDTTTEEVYDSGRYSPKLLTPTDIPAGTVVLDPTEEISKLLFSRQKFLGTGSADIDADKQLMQKVKEGMLDDEDENDFTSEHVLASKQYLWADKYRPRKPRYFNRVHTGYEWNKYNQTHYDPENPPPKIVQGYKFNIFYPDLIDKRQTPRYTLEAIANEPDFVVLKFSSGPPYEDMAFKIVNREWEYGHKHGYKCQFSNDVFQLWFKFKNYKYRR